MLRVSRPQLTSAPPPLAELEDWVIGTAWQHFDLDAAQACRTLPAQNSLGDDSAPLVVQFEDDPARVGALDFWRAQHHA